jgi:DNA-binding CsgD family transcriptional regulator
MEHLYLLYFFLTFAVGSVSLSIAAFIYAKTKYTLARNYLIFYSLFTVLVASEAVILYLRINFPHVSTDSLLFFLAPVGFSLMFVSIWFMHVTYSVPHARIRNMVAGGIVGFIIVQHCILGFLNASASRQGSSLPLNWWVYTIYVFIVLGVIYILSIALMYEEQSQESFRKKLMKKGSIPYLFVLPVVFVDMFFRDSFPVRLFPLYYCFTSIAFTYDFLRYYSVHHISNPPHKFLDERSEQSIDDGLFAKFETSPREQEIIELILQGHTYQKIGEMLYISPNTVKTHVSNIYTKCRVKSRYELMVLFTQKPAESDSASN